MFGIGEKVVHNDYGICCIVGIGPRRFPGQKQRDYYEMMPLKDDGFGTVFYTAVEHNEKLRAPMTREQILEMIDAMPDTKPMDIESSGNRALDMENIRNRYNSMMTSGDPQDWVILLRTIYCKNKQLSAQRKRISEFESHARDNSERLLYGEISGVMDIPIERVEQFITERIDNKKTN